MTRTRARSILMALTGSALLLGCSTVVPGQYSAVTESWGDAQRANVAAMIANPDAPPWGTGPVGLDPGTAERVAERYYEGQLRVQQQTMTPLFSVGGQ